MKKLLLFLFTLVLTSLSFTPFTNPAYSITVKTIGSTGDFASITAALTNLQVTPATDALIWELQAGYTSTGETFPITFSAANLNGINAINTLTIRPAANATGLLISNSTVNITVLLSGASYVNFDGRPGGVGTAKELTISNTFVTAHAAVQLQNTSHHNTFRYVSMKGQNLYVLTFYGIGVTGLNTDNTVDYCDVSNSGTGNLQVGIFSYSNTPTATSYNQRNTISNCNISDFFHATNSAWGIYLATGNSNWTITGNSIYQTAPRPMPYSAYGIMVSGTGGSNFNISNNYIGGSAPNAGGTPWTISSGNASFYGMYFLTNSTTPAFEATVTNNTITNLDITNTNIYQGAKFIYLSSSATSGTFTFSGNTIGSSNATDAIVLRGGTSGTSGIEKIGTGTSVNCLNNTIGGITTLGAFSGIYMTGGTTSAQLATHNINGNTIGSASVANSIKVGNAATVANAVGIYNATYRANSISNNTIANITNLYEGNNTSATIKGLYFGGVGAATVNGNQIFNLISKSSTPGTLTNVSVIGIHKIATAGACSISQNLIYGLENQSPTGAVNIAGISITGISGSATVARNTIYGLSLSTVDPLASISGCFVGQSLANFQNNDIRLGTTASGADITTGYAINGIHNIAGSIYYYFNTLYISGSNVIGSTSPTCALNGASAIANLQNNVLVNTRSGGLTGKHYALKLSIAPTTMDNNDYFVSGGTGFLNAMGATDYTDLATWKSTAVAGKDLVSLNVDPTFTSATNLIPTNGALIAGVPITGIAVDNAGTTRAAIPTMGAFEGVACSNPTSGGTITSAQEGCNPFDPALINSTTASGHYGILEYKWQQSTTSNNSGFTDIMGAITDTYDPGSLTQTTWFKRLARVNCKADWVGAAESNVVEMTAHPVPSVTTASTASVCSGSSPAIALTASVESTFTWTVGTITGNITGASSGSGATIDQVLTNTGTVAGTVEYIVTPTSLTGTCAGAATPVTVTVNPIKNVSVSIIGNNSVCENTLVNYAAFPINAGAAPTYAWKVDGVVQGTNNTFSFTPTNGNVIICEVTPDASVICPSVSVAVSNAIIMVVTPNAATLSIGTTSGTVCSGGSLVFTATPTNEGTTPVYHWKVNGTDAGTNSPQFTYTAPNYLQQTIDVVTCELVSSSSCATNSLVTSNAVNITVETSMTAIVSIAVDANPICPGSSVVFTATPTNGGVAPVYVWKVNTGIVATGGDTYSYSPGNGDVVTCEMTPDATGTCIANNLAVSNEVTMEVNPTSASVNIAADLTTVCDRTTVNFTATPTNGGAAPTYQWKVNGADAGTGLATFSYTPVDGDIVICEMTSNAPCVTATPIASNPVSITVNPLLPASVSIAAIPSGPVCAGTSVTFTATPFNGGTTPTYQWKLGGIDIALATGSTYSYIPANGDAISVIMTADPTLACVSGSPATSTEMVMTVNPLLPASVSIAAVPSGPVCAGTSVTFTATPVNGGITPTYQWQLGGVDITGETASTYSYVPTNGDAISVVMTADPTLACGSGSPATSTEMVMTVNPLLPASVSIAAVPSGPVCAGTSVTFTATPVNGGITPTYQWQLGGVDITGETSSTYSYVPTNGDAISVVMTADPTLACGSGSPATSTEMVMTVNSLLTASVSIAAVPSGPVCAGTSVTFTATPVNGGTTPTYQWKLGGVDIAGETASTYSYVPTNGDAISVVMTADPTLACGSGSPATSTEMVMTVNPVLPASVSIAAVPSGPVCAGTSVTFTATPVNEGITPTYQWKLGGVDITGETASTYSYVPANGDAISVVMTADPTLACVSGSPATSTEMVMSVNPLLPASVSIAADANPACDGTQVVFTAIPINGGNAPTVEWFKNTVLVGTGLTYSYAPVNGDQVYAVMTTDPTFSCVTGSPATSNSVTMIVNPLPTAVITNNTGTNVLSCTVTSISLTASGGDTYQWNKGLGTNASVLITSAGNYQVTVTNANGCSAVASIVITQTPGISNVTASAGTITTIGGTTTLTVNATGGVQPYTYSLNGGTYQTSNTFIVGAGTYFVTAMDANGCTMNSNNVTVSDPVFLPSFLTYTGVLSVQTNSTANLSATLLNSNNKGISGRTIRFTVGSQSITAITNGQGRAAVTLVINQTLGTYQMITSFAGDATYASNSDNDQFTINAIQISVTASLVGTVTKIYDGNKTAFMLPANYQLTGITAGDNVSLNNPATGTYNNKNVGTNKTVTVTGLALTGPDAGKYILSSTTASANIGTITALKSAEIVTDVQAIETPTLHVYPNPFTEKLNIEFSSTTDTHAKIEIFNIAGAKLEVLFNQDIKANELYNVEYIPHLVSSQIVFYRLTMDGKIHQGKLIYQERR